MLLDLAQTGARTAKAMYGAPGWVAHHNTDLWRADRPDRRRAVGHVADGRRLAAAAAVGSLGLRPRSRAIWRKLYPLFKGAAVFFAATLVARSGHRRDWSPILRCRRRTCIRTAPRSAPGRRWTRSSCATCSRNASRPRDLLGVDAEFAQAVAARCARSCRPTRSARQGQLQEWLEDWDMRRAGNPPPPRLASVRPASQFADQRARYARAGGGGAEIAGNPRRRGDRLGHRLAPEPLGAAAATASTRTRSCAVLLGPRAHLSEPVRRASAVPDRRQLRRHRRHHRDAAAELGRIDLPAAGVAEGTGATGRCAACACAVPPASISNGSPAASRARGCPAATAAATSWCTARQTLTVADAAPAKQPTSACAATDW